MEQGRLQFESRKLAEGAAAAWADGFAFNRGRLAAKNTKYTTVMSSRKSSSVYTRIRQILESARAGVARSVNTTQVVANWLVGREIVEEEQKGKVKAGYGERLIEELSERLQLDFGNGYSIQNLRYIRQLYLTYPNFIDELPIRHALRGEFITGKTKSSTIHHALRGEYK